MRSGENVKRGGVTEYRSFRTGDGDRDRGTLNLMAGAGRGECLRSLDATVVTASELSNTCYGLPTADQVCESTVQCREWRVNPACPSKRTYPPTALIHKEIRSKCIS